MWQDCPWLTCRPPITLHCPRSWGSTSCSRLDPWATSCPSLRPSSPTSSASAMWPSPSGWAGSCWRHCSEAWWSPRPGASPCGAVVRRAPRPGLGAPARRPARAARRWPGTGPARPRPDHGAGPRRAGAWGPARLVGGAVPGACIRALAGRRPVQCVLGRPGHQHVRRPAAPDRPRHPRLHHHRVGHGGRFRVPRGHPAEPGAGPHRRDLRRSLGLQACDDRQRPHPGRTGPAHPGRVRGEPAPGLSVGIPGHDRKPVLPAGPRRRRAPDRGTRRPACRQQRTMDSGERRGHRGLPRRGPVRGVPGFPDSRSHSGSTLQPTC